MIFSKIAADIFEIAGDLAISEQSVKKIIIPALENGKNFCWKNRNLRKRAIGSHIAFSKPTASSRRTCSAVFYSCIPGIT
jgi:hypothetical protein